ncbi:unnamed protein product [Rangifer tarandus platyrhynchus]|uniref:Uncharacterized protein n=2 Tax=Rangifer tarandus platyrhynchus TaxID=3082113 RepID=A0ABN8XXS1_RANTA|nr:unnamed protein product [Rangifer tarandus platyrhynchus]CAI9691818.1 unnamed protein product [Rangifer tarandus platyrhynchus]
MAGFLLASEELRSTPDNFSGSRARWQMPSPTEDHWSTGEELDWVRNGALLLKEIRRFRMEEAVRPSSFHSGPHSPFRVSPHQLMWPLPMAQ